MPLFDFAGLAQLPTRLPNSHRRVWIAPGNLGTSQTINRMQGLVSHGKRDFRIRKLAIKLVRQCPNKDYLCFAQKIYDYCTHQIKYVFDPNNVELVEDPWSIVEAGGADCDSIVILLASLLESVGLACEYVTIKADVNRPNDFSHVYLECKVPRHGWVAMDPTMPDKGFGWKPGENFPRKHWNASKDAHEERDGDQMAGLGQDLPYAEMTKGVKVGHDWNWRPEASLAQSPPTVLTHQPEVIELTYRNTEPHPQQREEEILAKEQLESIFNRNQNQQPVEVPEAEPAMGTKALVVGVALVGLLWYLGRQR